MEAPSSWKTVKLILLKETGRCTKERNQKVLAIALTSVFSKWYASCLILGFERERKPLNLEETACGRMEWNK